MANVQREIEVPYAARQMYALVHDIESYPEFLPWCRAAQIIGHGEQEHTAELVLQRKGIESTFSTCNRFIDGERIEMELLNGPFNYLRGRWDFDDVPKGAYVALEMRYQFSNPLMGFMLGAVVEDIASELISSFKHRARSVYGSA